MICVVAVCVSSAGPNPAVCSLDPHAGDAEKAHGYVLVDDAAFRANRQLAAFLRMDAVAKHGATRSKEWHDSAGSSLS